MEEKQRDKTAEARSLIETFDPWKTIFYFNSRYHALVNDLLAEISAEVAEQYLPSPEWTLWNLGDPPAKLPETCPAWIYTNIHTIGSIEAFLQTAFNVHFKENSINQITKN